MNPESNPKVGPHVRDSGGTQHPFGKLAYTPLSKKSERCLKISMNMTSMRGSVSLCRIGINRKNKAPSQGHHKR